MARWTNEHLFDGLVKMASDKYKVAPTLIKAIIAAESGFNPLAVRKESPRASLPPTPDFPQGGDESRGLMQVLVRTARALGFTGKPLELYNTAVNIDLGTKLLAENLRRSKGNVDVAISAYNAGFSTERAGDGKRVSNSTSAKFINQDYVDRVRQYMVYFGATGSQPPGLIPPPTSTEPAGGLPAVVADTRRALGPAIGGLIVAVVIGGILFLLSRGKG